MTFKKRERQDDLAGIEILDPSMLELVAGGSTVPRGIIPESVPPTGIIPESVIGHGVIPESSAGHGIIP